MTSDLVRARDAPRADAELVRRDIDVGGSATDIFLPGGALSDDEAAPVVVMLHGTAANRALMKPLAMAVAETGALVYVPSWPVIDQVAPFPEAEGDEPFRRQSEAVGGSHLHAPEREVDRRSTRR